MAAISIRNLDDDVKNRLRVRAARRGHSMEAEAREILTQAVNQPERPEGWVAALIDRFAEAGGVELELPPRSARVRPVDFER
jgi:antitoxin FitA